MRCDLVRQFGFEAAHHLPHFPEGHKCRRLHGHSFQVEVRISGEVDPKTGCVRDFGEIRDVVQPIIAQLDHRFLNEVEGLDNPTSEILARWIWDRVTERLAGLTEIVIHETCTSRCVYRGPDS